MRLNLRSILLALASSFVAAPTVAELTLPPRFEALTVASGLDGATTFAIAPNGRIFVADLCGVVRVIEDGVVSPTPFVDLRDEVNCQGERGLLGLALDPAFATNQRMYLYYTVDPIFGDPDEPATRGAFNRLTRYSADATGLVADPASRIVLIGATPSVGVPACDKFHASGSLAFGVDGSLLVSTADGASFNDSGGLDPNCFGPGLFDPNQDIGSFRAQYLGSPAGKILRIDPNTGDGLADNPYHDGIDGHWRSKVWASGLRNPFRFAVRSVGAGPGSVYIGDVGLSTFEELNVAAGGENFGWPCFEASRSIPGIGVPTHSGCDTLETPQNPGPLTPPLLAIHHSNPALSSPAPLTGRVVVGGVFYAGGCYPESFRGTLFMADWRNDWIKSVEFDASDRFVDFQDFADNAAKIVDLTVHPDNGDVYALLRRSGEIIRFRYRHGDFNDDGVVDLSDLALQLSAFGQTAAGDIDGDNDTDLADLAILLAEFGNTCR